MSWFTWSHIHIRTSRREPDGRWQSICSEFVDEVVATNMLASPENTLVSQNIWWSHVNAADKLFARPEDDGLHILS